MEERTELELSRHLSQLADRLSEIDHEYAAKGLYKSGPRIRAAQSAIGEHYTDLAKRLLALADVQADPNAADADVMRILAGEHSDLRQRLSEIVDSTGGGKAAQTAADELMEGLRRDIEELASLPRVARIREREGVEGGDVYEVPPGWPSDIPPDDYISPNEQIGVSDAVEAEVIRPARNWTGVPS